MGPNTTNDDERAIRALVDTWLEATEAGDTQTVLDLMTDDVVFLVPNEEPFGKEAFEASSDEMKDVQIEGSSDIQEVQVMGDWAFLRNFLEVTMTPPDDDESVRRSGHTLTIFRKESDGQWRLARDANLVTDDE